MASALFLANFGNVHQDCLAWSVHFARSSTLFHKLELYNMRLYPLAQQWQPALRLLTKFALPKVNLRSPVGAIHTTSVGYDLMEFFEDPKNWGKTEVRCGRSWKMEELRIKSNSDLHKLWFILLKERNMLLTMEHYYKENYILFPSPERIDKVEESMKNLETVVRERNKAYHQLETGDDGEQPTHLMWIAAGFRQIRRKEQFNMPEYMNTWFKENYFPGYDYDECKDFMNLLREKKTSRVLAAKRRRIKYAQGLVKRFQNIDVEYLKELYPEFDYDEYVQMNKSRGHWAP